MILRHYTHRQFLPAIVARGGISTNIHTESPHSGYLLFELNPITNQLAQTVHQFYSNSEPPWDETDTVVLDFDFVKLQAAGIEVHKTPHHFADGLAPNQPADSFRFVQSFLSLGYLTEASREQLSEYY